MYPYQYEHKVLHSHCKQTWTKSRQREPKKLNRQARSTVNTTRLHGQEDRVRDTVHRFKYWRINKLVMYQNLLRKSSISFMI